MASRRRAGRNIQGPQSALTDFLATNGISAAQIRSDYEARVAAAQNQAGPSNADQNGEEDRMDIDEDEDSEKSKKRKRETAKAIEKIKKSKQFAKRKAALIGEPGEDDDDGLAFDMYSKAKILPGQMENCEECEKRFTVTTYTKQGPDGGLLCTKCGKLQEDTKKKDTKSKRPMATRGKKNNAQSNMMEGHASHGAKSLLEMCVERVAKSIDDIEDFGDLPPAVYDRLSMILSKHRVLDSRTLDLFLQSYNDRLAVYDCAKLGTDDFIKIFQVCPSLEKVDLRHAGQFKDKVLDFIMERKSSIRDLRLDAPNLITDAKWQQYLKKAGSQLESLQLSWLDFAFTNATIEVMVKSCGKTLRRLKLKHCFHLDDETLTLLCDLTSLEHLSLTFNKEIPPEVLTGLISHVGSNLETLCLREFMDADDTVIEEIAKCTKLRKLVITENQVITDDAYASLFTNWSNPPLERAIFTASRDVEEPGAKAQNEPEQEDEESTGPSALIGFSSKAFTALMKHSGTALQKLSIASCRRITHQALLDAFDGSKTYPYLVEIDVSFVSGIDTAIIAGILKSCPKMAKVVAFGDFDISAVVIPRGVSLIGVPAAQDAIIQEGDD